MRIASYNLENLFDRAKVMNLDSWDDGRKTLEDFSALNKLLGQPTYNAPEKAEMTRLMIALGLEASDKGPFVILRRSRGSLLKRPTAGGIEIVAKGRADWVGSLELRDEPVNEVAMRNTARVLAELGADVIGVVEAENRPALVEFNDVILPVIGGAPFSQAMVIDGNDERGIDVGIMTKPGYTIGRMRSHVDDRDGKGERIFSRDCPEFEISVPAGERLVVLVNHLKSKGYGSAQSSAERRQRQAERVASIYRSLRDAGEAHVAILGDLNDTPTSKALAPLVSGVDARDVFEHPLFDKGGYAGTFGLCNAANKIDFLMLSPALFNKVTAGGVFRRGMWPGSKPKRWDCFAELTKPHEAASDHAAIWADIDF